MKRRIEDLRNDQVDEVVSHVGRMIELSFDRFDIATPLFALVIVQGPHDVRCITDIADDSLVEVLKRVQEMHARGEGVER